MYSQNPNSATSLPNTKFIFPRYTFIILYGLFYQWGWRLKCWHWSVSCPNYYVLYIMSWNFQMFAAEQLLAGQAAWVALPCVHHGKNNSYWATIHKLSWSGHQIKVNTLAVCLFCRPSASIYRCTVRSHLCGTWNTWHPRGNIVKEEAKSFLLSSYLVLPPSPPQLIQP
jgi:hypothetical protein